MSEIDLKGYVTNTGVSLAELSAERPVLLVFLRHTGCPFCQEAMADVRANREVFAEKGVVPCFVHQGEEGDAMQAFFERSKVGDVARIADPERELYGLFDVAEGSLLQVFGPRAMVRATQAILKGHRPPAGKPEGNVWQLPGTVIVQGGRVVAQHKHRHQGDRADVAGMVCSLPG